jgi:hypothetical protein
VQNVQLEPLRVHRGSFTLSQRARNVVARYHFKIAEPAKLGANDEERGIALHISCGLSTDCKIAAKAYSLSVGGGRNHAGPATALKSRRNRW